MDRITQINERIREIQNLGRKALHSVTGQSTPPTTREIGKEEAFTEALEQALLQQTLKAETSGAAESENALSQLSAISGAGDEEGAFGSIIQLTAGYFGIDANLIRAIIKQESDFNPRALSPKGAKGLMQLMPETAAELGVDEAFDPAKNIFGGAKYLQQMLSKYRGDLDLALAAYNAGPATVDRAKGIPDIPETKRYVAQVRKYYENYSRNPINR